MSRVLPDASAFGAAFELISERFDVTQSARIPTAVFPVTHYTHHDAFFGKLLVFSFALAKRNAKAYSYMIYLYRLRQQVPTNSLGSIREK